MEEEPGCQRADNALKRRYLDDAGAAGQRSGWSSLCNIDLDSSGRACMYVYVWDTHSCVYSRVMGVVLISWDGLGFTLGGAWAYQWRKPYAR